MDRSSVEIEIGTVCCSLSGNGIGEKVKISRYDAYEVSPASRKQVVSARRTDRVGNQSAYPPVTGGA